MWLANVFAWFNTAALACPYSSTHYASQFSRLATYPYSPLPPRPPDTMSTTSSGHVSLTVQFCGWWGQAPPNQCHSQSSVAEVALMGLKSKLPPITASYSSCLTQWLACAAFSFADWCQQDQLHDALMCVIPQCAMLPPIDPYACLLTPCTGHIHSYFTQVAYFLFLICFTIMSTLYYFGPVTLKSDFTLYPEKPNTWIFDGALPLSSSVDDNDLPVIVYMYIGGGQALPLHGLYNVLACVCGIFQPPTAATTACPADEVSLKDRDASLLSLSVAGVCISAFQSILFRLFTTISIPQEWECLPFDFEYKYLGGMGHCISMAGWFQISDKLSQVW